MKLLYFFPLVFFAALSGILIINLYNKPQDVTILDVSPLVGKTLPDFEAGLLDGSGSLSAKTLQEEKVFLINFFASWCSTCHLEHEILQEFAKKKPVKIYGIAWKDKPEKTRFFIEKYGNPYAAIASDFEGRAAIALGLSGVPETMLVKNGIIRMVHRGVLNEETMQKMLGVIQDEN